MGMTTLGPQGPTGDPGVPGYIDWIDKKTERCTFINMCETILHSDDKLAVKKAYDRLFGMYRSALVYCNWGIQLSCLEEVIYKIFNDEIKQEENEYLHGEKYPAFVKLLAVIKTQQQENTRMEKYAWLRKYSVIDTTEEFPMQHLDKMLLNFVYNQSSKEEKNEALQFFLNKYITIFKVQK